PARLESPHRRPLSAAGARSPAVAPRHGAPRQGRGGAQGRAAGARRACGAAGLAAGAGRRDGRPGILRGGAGSRAGDPPPKPPKPAFTLRVCGKCIERKAGGGYNPGVVLREMQAGAQSAGWPAPEVELGKCTGNCEFGPTVRLVKGEYSIPVVVDDMDEQEKDHAHQVTSDMDAQRAFGLASRHIMSAKDDEDEEEPEPALN
ncbi:unnamed protein product, partial [Prorocentrum cordatum]